MGSILQSKAPNLPHAVAAIVYAEKNGQRYVLSVQRANTKKWNRQIMLGGAGHVKQNEADETAILRELSEELELKPAEIIKMQKMQRVEPSRPEHLGFSAMFFLVQIPFERMQKIVRDINTAPKRFDELRGARINRIETLSGKKNLIQPHYRDVLLRAQEKLRPVPRKRPNAK